MIEGFWCVNLNLIDVTNSDKRVSDSLFLALLGAINTSYNSIFREL